MKPRTKIEKDVMEMSRRLSPLTSADYAYARRVGVEHVALYTGKTAKCCDCGHEWIQRDLKKQVRCPKCGRLLNIEVTRKKRIRRAYYMLVVQSYRNWQVSRWFRLDWDCDKVGGCELSIREAVQQWVNEEGVMVELARNRTMGFYIDSFNYMLPMSIKKYHYYLPYDCVRVKSVMPMLKRNGFKSNLHGMNPTDLFVFLLTNPFAETLYKAGYGSLLRKLNNERCMSDERYVAASKIALRNHYHLSSQDDIVMWYDMVKCLIDLGKDIRNRVYVCPANLKDAHDKVLEEMNRKIERERQAREAEYRRIRLEQEKKDKRLAKSYVSRMKKFFGIMIVEGDISISALRSIAEFEEEGKELNHCVFANRYYAKENCLILSAKVKGERMETIEINLKDFSVEQSRGFRNLASSYHDEIVRIVNENIWKIAKAARKRSKRHVEKRNVALLR